MNGVTFVINVNNLENDKWIQKFLINFNKVVHIAEFKITSSKSARPV